MPLERVYFFKETNKKLTWNFQKSYSIGHQQRLQDVFIRIYNTSRNSAIKYKSPLLKFRQTGSHLAPTINITLSTCIFQSQKSHFIVHREARDRNTRTIFAPALSSSLYGHPFSFLTVFRFTLFFYLLLLRLRDILHPLVSPLSIIHTVVSITFQKIIFFKIISKVRRINIKLPFCHACFRQVDERQIMIGRQADGGQMDRKDRIDRSL